jgi:hypothetical protein
MYSYLCQIEILTLASNVSTPCALDGGKAAYL